MTDAKLIEYQHDDTRLEGYFTCDKSHKTKRPTVIVIHDWSGKNEFACQKAEALTSLGYNGFALDMYGKGVLGQTKEEKTALITPFLQNRTLLQNRVMAALDCVSSLDEVDTTKIGMIGFCFGGLCVLDLARTGTDRVRGVVSFHGLLNAPEKTNEIKAKVLALHGYDDPMAPPEQIVAFANEMTKAKADWQLHAYGQTLHAFTNPEANDPDFGTVYNSTADKRSWEAMKDFFAECF